MRLSIFPRLSAVCVAAAALTASVNASAHYYAIINTTVTNGDADDGDFISIWTNILHSTCNIFQHDFVTHELWYGVTANASRWVEVGFLDGADSAGGCQDQPLFWADQNSNGFFQHFPGNNWALGAWNSLEISNAGNCSWSVLLNGVNIGTSTSNCPGSGRFLSAGIESTSQTTGSVKGWLSNNWEQNGSGVWTQNWDNQFLCQESPNGTCTSGNPRIEWDPGIGTEEVLNESF